MEIYAPDNLYLVFKTAEFSIQPVYYEKVQDVIDALYKAGLSNLTDVVLSYDDTSKRVTVKCGRRVVVKLRGDIARMFGFLNDNTIRAFDEKGFTLALPETGNQYFYVYTDIIKSQYQYLFLLPPTQSSFQKGKTIDYHPITSLSDGGPIEFKVSGSGKEFLDLARSYLYLKVKVSKTDGSNLDGGSKVGFANYPVASLFNQVDVILARILGGKLISSATNTYAHRSILEVLLNYDKGGRVTVRL